MSKKKVVASLVFAVAFISLSSAHAFAETRPVASPSTVADQKTAAEKEKEEKELAEKMSNISQNCATIKQSLGQLQRADSRTRIYLGASYERIQTAFLTPLSVRLARNNRVDEALSTIEADFAKTQADFRSSYTAYMREMSSLMSTDCTAHPEEFYERLGTARSRRETLRQTTAKLSSLIDSELTAAKKLQESL